MQNKLSTVGVFIFLELSMPACMFSSSTGQFTWIQMQNKVSTAEQIEQPFIIVEREGRLLRVVAGVGQDRGGGDDGGEALQ